MTAGSEAPAAVRAGVWELFSRDYFADGSSLQLYTASVPLSFRSAVPLRLPRMAAKSIPRLNPTTQNEWSLK